MFWKLVREPFRRPRSRRRALWAVLAIALGTAVAAAMLSVSLDVGDRIGSEMRSLGANIVITPAADSLPVEIGGIDYRPVSEGAYLSQSSLPKLKQIFWGNNIIAFAPYLYVPARVQAASASVSTTLVGTWFDYPLAIEKDVTFRTGIQALNPTWEFEGAPPPEIEQNSDDGTVKAVVGRSLAAKLGVGLGDTVALALPSDPSSGEPFPRSLRVAGILTTGGAEEDQVFAPLGTVQEWASLPDKVRTVQLSALIKPEDELSRKGPQRMTPAEYDRWYCSPYISSILHQIGEALPGTSSRAVRQVAETQGNVLGKLGFLMGLLALVAVVAASLSISSLASLTVLERREEIGLMKALGGGNGMVAGFFLMEMAVQGLCGGLLGFAVGQYLAQAVGQMVFGTTVEIHWLVLPAMLLVALTVSFAGAIPPVLRAVREDPARVLRSA
ncbi:MAG: ABC transporter permease [Acidobacteria bacterium]|nr:ABC transporter permease [Acidobacteriota bacterium]